MMLKEFYFFESFIYWKDKLRERERDRKRERQIYTERKKEVFINRFTTQMATTTRIGLG